MKIGPGGYECYGPNVPDIWIYGGEITGKDKSWWGINFALNFQRFFILIVSGLFLLSFQRLKLKKSVLVPIGLSLFFLLLFPFWMESYVDGVVNNSDGADLTVTYQWGWNVYLIVLSVNLVFFISSIKKRN
ncbi:MAG: hypothetical protein H6598_03400 [Flavobacteriales bacterium]|nr:hypothetical protein [Flavobacteriales bacterium]